MKREHLKRLNKDVRDYFRNHGRSNLPWRQTTDPYRILVSEIMLQQTQVDRVIPFYTQFIRAFPSANILARAPLQEILKRWQGLGYNRRAKLLRDAARVIAKNRTFPQTSEDIDMLPGVGPYTARAIVTFTYDRPEIFIETNIRTVFLHYCFANTKRMVSDVEITPLIKEALHTSRMQPRDYYWALMDFGSYLKKRGVRAHTKSSHYMRQSKFEGSRRQLRGHILKLLIKKPHSERQLIQQTLREREVVQEELLRLEKEKLIRRSKKGYIIEV